MGNGTLSPTAPLLMEAVAILTRVLGYTTSDIATGSTWYDGYLSVAGENGLTQGLGLKGNSTLTRGEAAELFRNLLFTDVKGSEECYLVQKLGGTLTEDTVLLSLDKTKAAAPPPLPWPTAWIPAPQDPAH